MSPTAVAATPLRTARIGDRLPAYVIDRAQARRLTATALLLPGSAPIGDYRASLDVETDRFAAWDGRLVTLPPDGEAAHRLLIVDRYRQVYEVVEAASVHELPTAAELEEWFKFLATMCPECGVLDDPIGRGWVP
jgi:hypothetical protein